MYSPRATSVEFQNYGLTEYLSHRNTGMTKIRIVYRFLLQKYRYWNLYVNRFCFFFTLFYLLLQILNSFSLIRPRHHSQGKSWISCVLWDLCSMDLDLPSVGWNWSRKPSMLLKNASRICIFCLGVFLLTVNEFVYPDVRCIRTLPWALGARPKREKRKMKVPRGVRTACSLDYVCSPFD